MKKNFVRVMLFGALALTVSTTVTSCKDYDDDIKNLQEQIDKVTSTNPVSTEDMKTAISSAIQTLQTQLQTAIDGKADAKAVQDLLKTVEALQTALENKADASTIKTLGDQITALSEQVNSIEGTLNKTKEDLEAKVADLTEKLAGAASSEDLKKLADELAEAKNELKAVTEMAENNAAAIVSIQADILELQKLDGRITALETFNQNAASKDDLADYVAHSELAGLVDGEVLELLKDNGSIAKYVNDAIESQVLAEASAINVSIKGVYDKLATLSPNFETSKQEQATAYQTVTEITTIKTSYGYCATKEVFDGKVEAYFADYKKTVNDKFAALEKRLTALENQIQSIVYIPEYEDGQVKFMSYYYGEGEARKMIAQADPIQVKFRISPATAAANFVANYTPSFDAQEIKTRAAEEIYSIEGTPTVDEATGIVTYTLSTTTDKSYAISLNLKAKDATKNLTDISSNYFPVIADYRVITSVTLNSPNQDVATMLSDNAASKIDYGTGAKVLMTGKDRAGNAIIDEAISESAVNKSFAVKYTLKAADDYNDFKIGETNGVLELKSYSSSFNNKKVTAQARITMKDAAGDAVSTFTKEFAQVTAGEQVIKTLAVNPSGIGTVEFKSKGEEASVFDVDLTGPNYSTLGITEADYQALGSECFDFETGAKSGIKFAFKENTTTNGLTVVVPAGIPVNTYNDVTLTVTVSPTQKFTITANATVQITNADYALNFNTDIAAGGTMTLQPTYAPFDKPTLVSFSSDLKNAFNNYATVEGNADNAGASIKFAIDNAPIAGVSISEDHVLTVDGSKYKGDNIAVKVNVVGKNNEDADVTLSSAEKTLNITPTSLAGSWTAPASTTVKIGRDNYQSTFDLANGFSWKATNDKTIWKDGSANTTDWGASPLTVFGVDLPTFTVASADQQYVSTTECIIS